VEFGLAELGNPDLLLIRESAENPRPYCIFLEAKVIPYSASAISNSQGMTQRGYCSRFLHRCNWRAFRWIILGSLLSPGIASRSIKCQQNSCRGFLMNAVPT